jgi:hypothetical protein
MPTEIDFASASGSERFKEIERLNNALKEAEAELDKYKHISDRAIHYKHEARRRTFQRNILGALAVVLIVYILYLRATSSTVVSVPYEQGEVPHSHTQPLAPVDKNGELSSDE